MRAILDVLFIILNLYTWVIIANVIFSWLYAFNVVNSSNQFIAMIGQTLYNLTEPLLRPIRRSCQQWADWICLLSYCCSGSSSLSASSASTFTPTYSK